MKKRTKKLLSLLLAIAMILTLAPIAVFAEDEPAPADPVVVEEPAEESATGTVLVAVYAPDMADAILNAEQDTKLLDKQYIGSGLTGLLDPNNYSYGVLSRLQENSFYEGFPEDKLVFSLIGESGSYELSPVNKKLADVVDVVSTSLKEGYAAGNLTNEINKIANKGYRIYQAENVPVGDYALGMRGIEKPSTEPYGLVQNDATITVEKDKTTIAGNSTIIKGTTETTSRSGWTTVKYDTSHVISFTGYFLRKETRAFSFTTTDVAGTPIVGAEFVMVNRDELLGLLNPVIGVGKEVFTTAIKNLGNPEVFSFEELVKLHTNLLKQNEQGYIAIDPESVYGIIQAYLALLTDADIVGQFIERDADGNFVKLKQPLPAVLSATSDENGVVHFSSANNVTLTWLVTIITDFGAGILENLATDNPLLQSLLPLVKAFQTLNNIEKIDFSAIGAKELLDILESIPDFGNATFTSAKETILNFAENNADNLDAMMDNRFVRGAITTVGNILVSMKGYILDFVYSTLQNFGIVGEKFSNGNYLMFQYKVPVGEDGEALYARNPLVYTLNVKWVEPDNFYVTVADLGLVGPYLAEGFYEFVRNTTYEGPIASALGLTANNYAFASKVLTGQLDYTKKVNQQVQGAFSAYMADSLYKALGLDLIFKSKTIFLEGMNDYVLENSAAATNLRTYINNQAKKAKAVYTGTVDEDWVFYTLDASPTTTATKLINKSTEDIAAAMPNGSAKQLSVKETGSAVSKIVQKIGTRIEETNAKIVDSIKASITKVFGDIGAKLKDGISKVVSGLFSSIFNGGSNAETPAEDVPVDAGA